MGKWSKTYKEWAAEQSGNPDKIVKAQCSAENKRTKWNKERGKSR